MKHILYCTINIKNKKFYIGVHQTETPYHFDGYLGNGCMINKPSSYNKGDTYFKRSLLKYGVSNFYRITLYVFDTREEALNKEREIVNEELISSGTCYNTTLGGGDPPKKERKIYQFSLTGDFIKTWESSIYIKRHFDSNVQLHSIITNKRIFAGYYWSYEDHIDIESFQKNTKGGFIDQYLIDGTFVRSFKSTAQAAQVLDIERSSITMSIFRKKPLLNFLFLKSNENIEERLKLLESNKIGKISIYKYDKNGMFLKYYPSKVKAIRDNPGLSQHKLAKALSDGLLLLNCYWSNIKVNNYLTDNLINKRTIIGQYSISGELIKEWESVKECKKLYKNCLQVCNNRLKQCDGYIFKYIYKDIV